MMGGALQPLFTNKGFGVGISGYLIPNPPLCLSPPLLEGGLGSSYPNAAAEGGGGKFWGYVTFMLNPPLVREGVGPFPREQGGGLGITYRLIMTSTFISDVDACKSPGHYVP